MTAQLGTILSIEDNDTDFMTLQFALRSAGVKNPVERWDNGRSALQTIIDGDDQSAAFSASLILLDLNLPGADGLQLLKALRARDPSRRIPVLVLSTSSHPRDIDACYLAGADGYVVKPLELQAWESDVNDIAEKWLLNCDRDRKAEESIEPRATTSKKTKPATPMRGKRERDMLRSQLTRTIECEIIPRLLIAHGCMGPALEFGRSNLPGIVEPGDEVTELVQLVLAKDVGIATSYIETRQQQGVTLETLFHALIVPAARFIGDLWKADICSFHEFSEALSRLQMMLVELSSKTDKSTLH